MSGEAPEEALKLGWAHGALITTFPGDTTMAKVEHVRAQAEAKGRKITKLIGGLPGPADIGLDRERGRIAVPLLTENRLEFVDLPQ